MKKYLYKDLYQEEDRHWWHQAKRKIINEILNQFLPSKKLRIIDIGCGTGKNIESLAKFGKVWGVDTSREAIKYCKKRGIKYVIKGDAEKTTLPSKKFDIATLLDLLEHTDDNKVLQETFRILKPNGYALITVPALPWMWSQWDVILHHKRRYTKKSLKVVLKRNNFRIIRISYMYSFLILPSLFVRFIKSTFQKKEYSSDFSLSNPIINTTLGKIASFERYFIKRGLVPIGLSLIVLAQKKHRKRE